jgi:membrane-associated protease RseP (regulator of RpoE activity)
VPRRTGSWPLAAVLLVTTFFTTTTLGGVFSLLARLDVIWSTESRVLRLVPLLLHPETIALVWTDPRLLGWGLRFSLATIFILVSHELGHWFACRRYGLPATPPYFLPAPLGLGTFGAFIRIRAAIRTRRELFDVGVAGPLAGFVALLPVLAVGIARSTPVDLGRLPATFGGFQFFFPGENLLWRSASWLGHGPLGPNVLLNPDPFLLAAWVGMLATALNLLPLAQLDGGHILYAVLGRRQRRLALPLWLMLVALGFVSPGWWLWAVVVLVLGLRHPPLLDETEPLGAGRRTIAVLALIMLVLCFTPAPLQILEVTAH